MSICFYSGYTFNEESIYSLLSNRELEIILCSYLSSSYFNFLFNSWISYFIEYKFWMWTIDCMSFGIVLWHSTMSSPVFSFYNKLSNVTVYSFQLLALSSFYDNSCFFFNFWFYIFGVTLLFYDGFPSFKIPQISFN